MSEKRWKMMNHLCSVSLWFSMGSFQLWPMFCQIYQLDYLMMTDFISNVEWFSQFQLLFFCVCVWLLELYPHRDPPNPIVRCVPNPLWAVTMCFAPGVKCAREGYPNRESNMAMDGKSPIHTVGVLYGFIMGKTNMGTYGKIMENQSVHEGW